MQTTPPHHEPPPHEGDPHASLPGDVAARDLVALVRRQLRGRTRLGLIVGLVLSAIVTVISVNVFEPEWESRGIIRVSSTEPRILQGIPEWAPIPEFTSFVSLQASLLQSREILESATRRLVTHSSGWPAGEKGIIELEDAIEVNHRSGRQVIELVVRNHDARRAQIACQALMSALVDQRDESSRAQHVALIEQMQDQQAALETRIRESHQKQREIAPLYDATVIQRKYVAMVDELRIVEDRIAAMVARFDAEADASTADERAIATGEVSVEIGAVDDPELNELGRIQRRLRAQLENLDPRLSDQHPVARQLRTELARVQSMIRYRTAELSIDHAADDDADAAIDRLIDHRDRLTVEIAELREQKELMAALQKEEVHLVERLHEIEIRLESMSVEEHTPLGNRVHIASHASMPLRPASDRGLRMAIVGGTAAFLAPLCIIVVFGFMEGRIRFAETLVAADPGIHVLGVIPARPEESSLDDVRLARMGIEDVRHRLESEIRRRACRTLAITSARGRDGRTSICAALGRAFADHDAPTLLVDADVSDGGLSQLLGLDGQRGLADAMQQGRPTDSGDTTSIINASPTDTTGLTALAAGSPKAVESLHSLDPRTLEATIEPYCEGVEHVLIDTGPYLESVDADAAIDVADCAVVVVRRFTRIRDLQVTLHELRARSVDIVGIIFNDAERRDCRNLQDMVLRAQRIESTHRDIAGRVGGDERRKAAA